MPTPLEQAAARFLNPNAATDVFGNIPRNVDEDNLSPIERAAANFLGTTPGIVTPQREVQRERRPSLIGGEFSVGFKAGVGNVISDVKAIAGLAELGLGGGTDILENVMAENEARRLRLPERTRFGEIELFDEGGLNRFTRWAARTLGEQVPVIASIIGAGGIGGIVGRLVAKKAINYASAKIAMDKFGAATVANVGRVAATRTGAARAGLAAGRYGTTAGAITGASTIETGATAQEHFEATGTVNPLLAIAAGIAKGSLEAIVPLSIGRQFRLSSRQTDNLLDKVFNAARSFKTRRARLAAGLGATAVTEAATEAGQESIDIILRNFVDENYELLGPESRERLLESTAAGFLVGGILGGAAGGVSGQRIEAREQNAKQKPDPDGVVGPGRADPTVTQVPSSDIGAVGPDTTAEELTSSFDPNLQGEHVAIASEVITTADGATVRVFRSGGSAVDAAALADVKTGQVQQVLGLNREAVDDRNLTADVVELSEIGDITVENARIKFLALPAATLEGGTAAVEEAVEDRQPSPEVKAAAISLIKEARDLAESADTRARASDGAITKTELLSEARTKMVEAARLGARIVPKGNEDFMLIGKAPEDAVQRTTLPARDTVAANAVIPPVTAGAPLVGNKQALEFVPQTAQAQVQKDTGAAPPSIQLTRKAFAAAEKRGDIIGNKLDVQDALLQLPMHRKTRARLVNLAETGSEVRMAEVLQKLDQGGLKKLFDLFPMAALPTDTGVLDNSILIPRLASSLVDITQGRISIPDAVQKYGFRVKLQTQRTEDGFPTRGFTLLGGVTKENEFVRGITFPESSEQRLNNISGTEQAAVELRMKANGRTSIGPDGKKGKYDAATHKPGTVHMLVDPNMTSGQRKRLRLVQKLYQKLIPLFAKDAKLVLGTVEQLNDLEVNVPPAETAGGYHAAKTSPYIDISRIELNSTTETALTAIHEFGHLVAYENFANSDPGIKDKVMSAYNRSLARAAVGGGMNITRGFISPGQMGQLAKSPDIPLLGPGDVTRIGEANLNYYFGFSEFMAEQFTKWASTNRKPLDVVEEFFDGFVRKMISYLRTAFKFLPFEQSDLALRARDFRPEFEVKEWLDSFMEEQSENGSLFNAGTFNEGEGTTHELMARPSALSVGIGKLGKNLKLPKKDVTELRESVDRIGNLSKYGFNILQMAQQNPTVASLQKYVELARQWYNAKMRWVSISDKRVKQWKSMHPRDQDALSKFLFHIDSMEYLGPDESPRHPTEGELAKLIEEFNLNDESVALYHLIREDFNTILRKIEEVGERDVMATYSDFANQEIHIATLKKEMRELRARPYFPHARFGEYILSVRETTKEGVERKGKLLHMEQFETRKAALAAVKSAQSRFPEDTVGVGKMPETVLPFRGLPPTVLRSIKAKLELSDEQRVWLDDLISSWAPSASFRHHLSRRQNISGYSQDAMRTYASYFWHGSNYLARIEFKDPLQQTVKDMRQEQTQMTQAGIITDRRQELTDFVQDHLNEIMNPTKDFAQWRSLAFMWWLGFSPASAALNFTQVPLVAYPYLASRYGDLKAVNALRKSVMGIHNLYKNKTDKVSDIFIKGLDRAMDQGFIDESQATELAGTAQGDYGGSLLPMIKTQRWITKGARAAAWMFHQSEKLNRRIVFRAAWELALANPDAKYLTELRETNSLEFDLLRAEEFSPQEAMAFIAGRDAVDRSQYEYASWARPRFMRGPKGIIFTFFMFLQNSTYFAFKSPGATRYWIMMLATAGMMGVPGAEDLLSLARLAARKLLGKDFNVEKEVRKFVLDMMGEDSNAAELILHGTSRVGFGLPAAADLLGIPFPAFDMSANISMGQIFPGIADLGSPVGSFEEKFARSTTNAAGATIGMGMNIIKAISDDSLPANDFKRWERALPRAGRNIAQAWRYYNEERERASDDRTIINFDVTDPHHLAEIVFKAAGFTPTRLSRKWDRERMLMETQTFWDVQKGMLMRQFDHAVSIKSTVERKEVLARIRRFNNEVPFAPMKITGAGLKNSVKSRIRRRVLRERGLGASPSQIPLAREINRLFPEIAEEDLRVR